MYFINPNVGWVVNVSGQIRTTKDGGNTWTQLINQPSSFRCVGFFDFLHGCIGNLGPRNWAPTNNTNPMYITSDGGNTLALPVIIGSKPTGIYGKSWDSVSPATLLVNMNRVRFLNDTLGYAVGQRVYKYSKSVPSAIQPVEELAGYAMLQNAPNPFQSSTIITYSIPLAQVVQIEIFDDAGRKIKTLVNEMKSPGTYKTEFTMPQPRTFSFICSMLAGPFAKRVKMLSVE